MLVATCDASISTELIIDMSTWYQDVITRDVGVEANINYWIFLIQVNNFLGR